MKISGGWIDHPGPQSLCAALEARGHKAYFVGGCVRNAILNAPISDIDLTTDATPDQVLALAKERGFRAVPTGIDHGTVTILVQSIQIEVTTFRKDVETDGRHAVVAFSKDIAGDAARRDFTMNALYADARGDVIDPLGSGVRDALARRLRFVGEPEQRIREDYLRILRFFRFHAVYGNAEQGIDPEGLAACAALADGIETLSRERVGSEMRKLLSAEDPAPSVASMAASGVLARVLPGSDTRFLPVLVHLEDGADPRWIRRLAILGGEGVGPSLRLSSKESRDLAALKDAMAGVDAPAALGWKLGAELAWDALLLRAALFEQPVDPTWKTEVARGALAQFPVSAADLMPELAGPELGRRLRELQADWLASGLSKTKEQLLG